MEATRSRFCRRCSIFLRSPMRLTRWNGDEENRDETSRPTLLAAFANTQFYGDGMRIAPQADLADGTTRYLPHLDDESSRAVLYVSNGLFRTTPASRPRSNTQRRNECA